MSILSNNEEHGTVGLSDRLAQCAICGINYSSQVIIKLKLKIPRINKYYKFRQKPRTWSNV